MPFRRQVRTVKVFIRLSRWQEFLPFVISLSLAGGILASHEAHLSLDLRLLWVTVANVLVVTYAFMINEIEDAEDDARDTKRERTNPVASGALSPRRGYIGCIITAGVCLFFYLLAGRQVMIWGVFALVLSHLYSWRRIRLKAWPIVDIVSHVLMLSGLLIITGFITYSSTFGTAWYVILATIFLSAYGQFYNQLRDFEPDVLAGLKNTSILLGEATAKKVMYGMLLLAAISGVGGLVSGVLPVWFLIIFAVAYLGLTKFSPGRRITGYSSEKDTEHLYVLVSSLAAVGVWLAFTLAVQFSLFTLHF